MKAIICGGRNVGRTDRKTTPDQFSKEIEKATAARKFVSARMDALHAEQPICEVLCGNEGGAERLGVNWAVAHRIPHRIFERKNRTETTTDRNLRMIHEGKPDVIIAFGGGESTTALLREARKLAVTVVEIAVPEL